MLRDIALKKMNPEIYVQVHKDERNIKYLLDESLSMSERSTSMKLEMKTGDLETKVRMLHA